MMLKDLSVKDFVAETASDSPAPGGGSVSALAAAQAAALLGMVANLTVKSKNYTDVHEEMKPLVDELAKYHEEFTDFIDKDANSFNGVIDAFKLPKSTDEEKAARSAKIQEEYKNAANVPFTVGMKTVELIDYAEKLVEKGNKNAITDVGVGVLNIKLAVTGAFYNVKINLGSIKDEAYVKDLKDKMAKTLKEVDERIAPIVKQVEAEIE
ncbi:cyclodeaminase/cyclohydrolase family protein [Peptoniphilus obesi]|uniref:cyclodeaminase/cyclohydrolase family protein n=1 Tax=Peptoniphilus obesi TaxID=1472765 RepID=UPI0004AD4AB7|nr:cyclodeaminase/cyclohydrolase family protein [Peptoniphilus obesi]